MLILVWGSTEYVKSALIKILVLISIFMLYLFFCSKVFAHFKKVIQYMCNVCSVVGNNKLVYRKVTEKCF